MRESQTQPTAGRFPPTRYQGSKRKLLDWLWEHLGPLEATRCLDLFSGTAAVAYLFKVHGKQVTANDRYRYAGVVARALVQNDTVRLDPAQARALLAPVPGVRYARFVADTFRDRFFLPEEDEAIDVAVQNIHRQLTGHARDLALYALFQACLAKRPFNLFHRANLAMRTRSVSRSFGNKVTWDRPLAAHFVAALQAANRAIFSNGHAHRVLTCDFLEVPGSYDLVYMDPPYVNARGVGVDYLDFYHFLEGLTEYAAWPERITLRYRHRPYARDRQNPWTDPRRVHAAFDDALDRYREALIAISYRSAGIPSVPELQALLARHGRTPIGEAVRAHQYVLSTARNQEVLLISGPPASRPGRRGRPSPRAGRAPRAAQRVARALVVPAARIDPHRPLPCGRAGRPSRCGKPLEGDDEAHGGATRPEAGQEGGFQPLWSGVGGFLLAHAPQEQGAAGCGDRESRADAGPGDLAQEQRPVVARRILREGAPHRGALHGVCVHQGHDPQRPPRPGSLAPPPQQAPAGQPDSPSLARPGLAKPLARPREALLGLSTFGLCPLELLAAPDDLGLGDQLDP